MIEIFTFAFLLQSGGVALAITLMDICWTKWFLHVAEKKAVRAGLWSALIMVFSIFATTSYVSNLFLAPAAIIGAFFGTFITLWYENLRTRKPDFIIGNDYLRRWWVIPRNRFFNIYLHNIRHSDDDRALHDHMYFNISVVLKGGYFEINKKGRFWRKAGSLVFRFPTTLHRLEIEANEDGTVKDAWTLFITGPRLRNWGFDCPQGFVPWEKFVDPNDAGKMGKGCDQ